MDDKPKHNIGKIIRRILIGLAIVALSAAIAILVIKLFFGTPAAKVTNNITAAQSPSDVIKKYTEGYKLDGYAIDKSASDSIISYKLSDTAYTVQISSIDNVQFTKSDNSIESDITKATDNATSYLTTNGFTKVSDQIYTNQTQPLYDSPNSVCKIFNSFYAAKKTSSYGLVCADKKQFITERNSVQTLLTMYTQTGGADDFKNIVRTTFSESNKALSMLSIVPQDKAKAPYTLIFASIDSKWAYIGSRVTPSIDVADSFQISDSLKAAVNNPKYNGFLAKYIY